MRNIIMCSLFSGFILLSGLQELTQEHERWDIKTLTDGFKPDMSDPVPESVAVLGKRKIIRVGNNTPRMGLERTIIKVSGTVVGLPAETDGDIHVELKDNSSDSTIACEAVNPDDSVVERSPYLDKFKIVRAKVAGLKIGDQVTFTGVLFQDKYHNPTKMRIRNFLEVHPILSVQ